MVGSPRSAPAASRSWRRRPQAELPSTGGRLVRRVVFSLLGLALTGLLGWLLWWWIFLPTVYLVGLPVVDYDALAVPPIVYVGEDADAFAAASSRSPAISLRDLQTSETIPTLSRRLQGIVARPQDLLILYLSAHGVSEDGTAYVLCSDFLRQGETGRYPLADLLRQVEQCPAALKLLILDTDSLAADPRLGMLVNEFPRLVEAEVKQVQDPNLWVLTANRQLEVTHVSHFGKRSLFGQAVTTGLQGAADRDRDGLVDLSEFFDFVRGQVAAAVQQAGGGQDSQTPSLLHAGVGSDRPTGRLVLLPVSDRGSRTSQSESSPAAEPATDAAGPAKPAAEGTSAAGSASPAPADPGKPGPTLAGTGKAGDSDRKLVRELLGQAWELRDRMQSRTAPENWSPVDYAPHLWHEFEQLLLGYELRYRCGRAFDAQELADGLRTNVLPLKELLAGGTLPAGVGPAAVLVRLAEARRQFQTGSAKAALDQDTKELRALKEALQLKNDLLHQAVYWVRWHAQASRRWPRQHRLYPRLSVLLGEVTQFVAGLDEWTDAGTDARSPRSLQRGLSTVAQKQQKLQELRDWLQKEGFERDAREVLKGPLTGSAAATIEALLSTPGLPGPLRLELLNALGKVEDVPAPSERTTSAPAADAAVIPRSCQDRLREQAALELQLVALVDPAGKLAGRAATPVPENLADAAAFWEEYRSLGKELKAFYQELPAQINAAARSTDPAVRRSGARRLRLVDARDARKVEDVSTLAVPEIRLPAPPAGRLVVDGPRETVPLLPDNGTDFELVIQATGLTSHTGQLQLHYDPGLLTVTESGAKASLEADKWGSLTLREGRNAFTYRVRGRAESGATVPLIASVRCGGESAKAEFEFRLPIPDVIDLVVLAAAGTPPGRPDTADRISVRPFPNRVTAYRWELVNRSGRPKKVTVQIAALPERRSAKQRAQESPWDELGNLRAGFKPLTPALDVELPAEATGVPIPFPGAKPPAGEKPVAPADKPTEPKPDARPVVTYGLVCLIRERGTQQRSWVRYVDLAPLRPKDYLDPVVSYDLRQRLVLVDVKPPQAADDGPPAIFPPVSEEQPIQVIWEVAKALDGTARMKDRGEITSPGGGTRLFVQVEPGANREVPVRLTVDGWPRAFQYQVPCDRDRQRVDRLRSLSRIQIVSPPAGKAFRVPLKAPLDIQFQVDAPEDAFQEAGDVVEVALDAPGAQLLGEQSRRQLFSERQVDIRLQELGPEGSVKLDTRVSDFTVPLDPGGLKNLKVNLVARLRLPNRPGAQEGPAAEDRVEVLLDGAPPVLDLHLPATTFDRGDDVKAAVKVLECLSGVTKLEVGFDLDESGDLEEAEKPKVLRQAGSDGVWSLALPTQDLEAGTYTLLVRATSAVDLQTKESRRIAIRVPRAGMPAKKAASHTIEGRVVLQDGRPLPRFQVSLQGTGQTQETGEDGRFTFRDLAPGKYTLQARGSAIGRRLTGSKDIVLPAATDPARVEIRLEW
jgi:hypothetical protein